jgi:hypothetical protein
MSPRPPARAAEIELVRRLDAEWRILSQSRRQRDRLVTWRADGDRLTVRDGDQLLEVAQRRDAASWAALDQILVALPESTTDRRGGSLDNAAASSACQASCAPRHDASSATTWHPKAHRVPLPRPLGTRPAITTHPNH